MFPRWLIQLTDRATQEIRCSVRQRRMMVLLLSDLLTLLALELFMVMVTAPKADAHSTSKRTT